MSDPGIKFSKSIGWTKGSERTGRYAMIIDHGKILYAENEPAGDVTVRGLNEVGNHLDTDYTFTRSLVLRQCLRDYEGES